MTVVWCVCVLCVNMQGMVEAGDTVSTTLKKEFGEEAMNSLEASEAEKKETEEHINALFHNGEEVGVLYLFFPNNSYMNKWVCNLD